MELKRWLREDMDNKCVIIVREGISGGTASLSFRLLMALRDNGYNCMYFCRQINDENNYFCLNNYFGCVEIYDENCLECNDIFNLDKCSKCIEGYEINEDGECIKIE